MPDDPALADEAFPCRPHRADDRRSGCTSARSRSRRCGPRRAACRSRADGDRGRSGHSVVLRALARQHRAEGRAARGRRGQGSARRWPATRQWRSSPTGAEWQRARASTLFGAPARLPAGPAVLALETGAPTWVVATRRAGAQYRTRIEHLAMPATGSPRSASPASSPPRSPPSSASSPTRRSSGGRSSSRSGTTSPERQTPDGPRRPAHPQLASDGVSSVGADPRPRREPRELDVIAITDHERIDAAHAAQRDGPGAGHALQVIVGEEVTTRGGHVVALFIDQRIRPWGSLRSRPSRASTNRAASRSSPIRSCPIRCAPAAGTIRRLLDDQDPLFHPDAIEAFNPTTAGMRWARARAAVRRARPALPRSAPVTPTAPSTSARR